MISKTVLLISAIFVVFSVNSNLRGEENLIAHWDFNEGKGGVVHDRSGKGHDGKIVNAKWVKTKDGHALQFGQTGSYVDFGKCPDLDITGEATFVAWVKPTASHFKTRYTEYEILGCEIYPSSGYLIRLCGQSSRPYYRASHASQTSKQYYDHFNGRTPLDNHTFHQVALVITKNPTKDRRYKYKGTFYVDGVAGSGSLMYYSPDAAEARFTVSGRGQSFEGQIDDVRIYGRALSTGEILDLYKQGAASHGKDTSWLGHIELTPFFHFGDGEIFVRADFRGIKPPAQGETVSLELGRPGEKPLQILPIEKMPASRIAEMTFPFKYTDPGKYEIRAIVVNNGKVRDKASLTFQYPLPAPQVADPTHETVPALSPPKALAPYQVNVTKEGGFNVTLKGRTYPVSSFFSYPNGGENVLSASKRDKNSESAWQVKVTPTGKDSYHILGEGKFYTIDRRIRLYPNRINVKDTVTIKHSEAVGIIFSHRIGGVEDVFLGGHVASGDSKKTLYRNPTVFAADRGLGLGMAALDKIFIIQSSGEYAGNKARLGSNEFAMDTGASYTLEWAVYPTAGDYYDFINQVRKDEGRNNVTVEGTLLWQYAKPPIPTRKFIHIRNAKYIGARAMAWPIDDPLVTQLTTEFLRWPKEMAKHRDFFAAVRAKYPDISSLAHYTINLYGTNKPKEAFPDSFMVDANGKPVVYNYLYHNYYWVKKPRVDEGWRFFGFVPTLDNSYGKELLHSIDVLMDKVGLDGVFIDGFLRGYGSVYTYNQWDNYSADIDPKTKMIVRKKGNTMILSHDLMVAFAKKIIKKGGTVIACSNTVTRAIGHLPMVFCYEIQEGPKLHLNPSPICLGNSNVRFNSDQEIVNDIHRKLAVGNLYFYYMAYDRPEHRLAASEMYPITVQEIRSNYIKGKERLVTALSGVYGWRNEKNLHFTHFYDTRGREAPAGFLTTVDASGIRTRVSLKDGKEMAIVKKIPITFTTPVSRGVQGHGADLTADIATGRSDASIATPVNIITQQYDSKGIRLLLNGDRASVSLCVRNGDFPVTPGAQYRVTIENKTQTVTAGKDGTISLAFTLDGPASLLIDGDPKTVAETETRHKAEKSPL